ncbi:MAG: flagellar hook-basal body complex protein, partial [Rhodospirillales bacterium]|nr:flagellar hook-basal body complex protein [Rhodospirillales bacterium]
SASATNVTSTANNTANVVAITVPAVGVAQVNDVTIAGTIEAGDNYSIVVNGTTFSYNLTATDTINTARDALISLINADAALPVTASANGLGVVRLTADATNFAIDTSYALVFNSSGLLSAINVAEVEILGYANGAADMDDAAANSPQITLDFGTVGEANGMTQFGAAFTPVFITQNGSQFGTFAGVTISENGLVTALFDNGETRPVYQIPLATFTNVNGLETRTGNAWNQTQFSGDYTLRVAGGGAAGTIVQSTLEQSTVDIGEEFTNMIVVQRAYASAAKIISTADAMLEQLLQVKR